MNSECVDLAVEKGRNAADRDNVHGHANGIGFTLTTANQLNDSLYKECGAVAGFAGFVVAGKRVFQIEYGAAPRTRMREGQRERYPDADQEP